MSYPTVVSLPNEHLQHLESDKLFHLEIPLNDPDILSRFRSIKFVCVGGTAERMKNLALHLAQIINLKSPDRCPFDYFFQSERYSGFKVGPVFCVSHGIGMASLSVMLHEVFKLLHRAECSDVTLLRVGTCGGIGIPPGTLVVTTSSLTAGFEPFYTTSSLGKLINLPTQVDPDLIQDLLACRREDDVFQVVTGKTYCAEDFYQGQGRLDGSFCDYDKAHKDEFFRKLQDLGVCNIEMESAALLGMANKVGIKAAVVCGVLVDRLVSDMITLTTNELHSVQDNAIQLVGRFIQRKLNN